MILVESIVYVYKMILLKYWPVDYVGVVPAIVWVRHFNVSGDCGVVCVCRVSTIKSST